MKEFRVVIAGGREFSDYKYLCERMDAMLVRVQQEFKIVVLCGKARGADTLGEQYAKARGYEVNYYPADWNRYGRSAGHIRNSWMARDADAVVVFWDGKSIGSKDMICRTKESNKPLRVFRYA